MAARFKTKKYTFTGTTATLDSILNSPNDKYASSITIRAAKQNLGEVEWSDGGEAGGFLDPREAASFDLTGKYIAATDIHFTALVGDKIYVTVMG